MVDQVHNANVGSNIITEREIKGGRGPWIERTYNGGNTALTGGTIAAISDADDLVYGFNSADTDLDVMKGVVLQDKADTDVTVTLLVLGTANREELNIGGVAPTLAELRALEERHIYAVG